MTTFIASYPDSSVKRDPGFSDWFGPSPRGESYNTNPYNGYPRETLALPDVYKGSNPYLTNIMLTLITEEELIPTRILLPLRTTQNETSITWDEFHFNNTLLGPVPEEGVSRLVTQQISERRDHYIRYGLAFMIEHGFMHSPKGQMTYKANLEQIRDAVLQSLYIGVIEALLRCKTNSQFFTQCYGRSLTALSARKRLEMECESFAEIQKSDHGWEMLNSRAQRNLKLHGVTPDAWIVDDGVKKYIASRRESWAYFLHGQGGEKLRLENQGVGDPKSLDVASNTLIFETKQFNLPNHDDPVNITSRRKAIGEYVVSFPHLDYASCGKYTSSMRDIMVYDEDRDGFTKLSLVDGLQHCQRFDEDDGRLCAHDFNPGRDGDDMFFTDKCPHGVDFFAQMTDKGLPDQAVKDWITTVVAQFDARTASELTANLETLVALADKLEAMPENNENTERFFDFVKVAHTTGTADDPHFDNTTKFLKLDAILGEPEDASGSAAIFAHVTKDLIPYGFSSYAGICEMAKHDVSVLALADDARKARKAIDVITQKINAVSYGNFFTEPSALPSYVRDKCVPAAVYANIVRRRMVPVVAKGGKFDLKYNSDLSTDQTTIEEFRESVSKSMNFKNVVTGTPEEIREGAKQSDALCEKITRVLVGIAETLPHVYRKKLMELLGEFKPENVEKEEKKKMLELMESLYDTFLKEMDGHDWYTICKALDAATSLGDLREKLRASKDNATRGTVIPKEAKKKTAVTQLTCSDELREYLRPDKFLFSYLDAGADSFASFGAGEIRDEGSGAVVGAFGIKRKAPEAPTSHTATPNFEAWWEHDEHVSKRLEAVHRSFGSPLERFFGKAFLGNAVNGKTLQRFISVGCAFPFNLIYARPYQTYSVSTGICMKAGSSTGETLVGHADFQLGDNVIQKVRFLSSFRETYAHD